MTDSISYRSLTMVEREIRLLRIDAKPSSNANENLKCSIEHITLGPQAPPYAAISYCWGPNTNQAVMNIDGRDVKVPHSAESTLRYLAQEPGELIWIDAVCINQQDNVEKGRQVAMMKDIYTGAKEVRIWLGNLDNDVVVKAINSARSIYHQCMHETNDLADLQLRLYGTGPVMGFKYSDKALPEKCDWKALQALYSLPWFTRLWVVQEVALARKAICHTGQHKVDAEVITLAARWMVHRCYAKHFEGSQVEGIENASSMYRPTSRPLSNQLRRMHRQRCKDPRDRVYGLLGLLNPDVATAIVPDYTLSVVDVYANAIRAGFGEDESLDMLRFAAWFVQEPTTEGILARLSKNFWWLWSLITNTPVAKEWPSWVLKVHAGTETAHGSCLNVQVFEKSDWPLQTRTLSDPLILSVKGLKLSHLTYISEAFSEEVMNDDKTLAATIMQCTKQVENMVSKPGCAPDPDDLKLTFACGINAQNGDAELDETVKSQYEAFITWCATQNSERAKQEQTRPSYMMSRSHNRRFFITADGKVGMGTLGTRNGDHLCILSGTAGAFILRQEGQKWRFIGDAYCSKVMKVGLSSRR